MLVSFAVGLIGLIFSAKLLHKQSFLKLTTTRSKIDWKRFWFVFVLWGIFSVGSTMLTYYAAPEEYIFNFNPQPFFILCAIVILIMPLQTSFEEYLFRGYLMQGISVSSKEKFFSFTILYLALFCMFYYLLHTFTNFSFLYILVYLTFSIVTFFALTNSKKFYNYLESSSLYKSLSNILSRKLTPLILTSVGFGLLHGLNPEVDKLGPIMMVFYIGTGLVLGIMTLMDDGLELALGFHAANNMFTALLVTSDWSALQTDALLTYTADPAKIGFLEIGAPVLIIYPILLIILAKVYGWKNWKAKLFGPVEEPQKEDYKVVE
ncbi:MAG: CPBP family intramembrane metalloprotease [Winogradskyella sp.]|nr:CPBP family intramembrane metalloprotease [Winogradskyella sp.]NNK22011.1 CPBP family intramembrane metalloprotease [Winogradskyella sp.]